jgi:dTDP-4-amino-4,6-dideoxygalactose transaminase
MTEMQAAIGRIQLRKLNSWVEKRRSYASIFNREFSDCPCLRTTVPEDKYFHSYYKYLVFVRPERLKQDWSRDRVINEIIARGIPCFSGPCPEIYLEKSFKKFHQGRYQVAKELGETSLMLLVHPTLNETDIYYVVDEVKKIVRIASK